MCYYYAVNQSVCQEFSSGCAVIIYLILLNSVFNRPGRQDSTLGALEFFLFIPQPALRQTLSS